MWFSPLAFLLSVMCLIHNKNEATIPRRLAPVSQPVRVVIYTRVACERLIVYNNGRQECNVNGIERLYKAYH